LQVVVDEIGGGFGAAGQFPADDIDQAAGRKAIGIKEAAAVEMIADQRLSS
jgi:hypothetical protein